MLETGIKDAILTDTGIAAVVGDRLRPLGVAPDDARPYLTYQVTERTSDPCLDGSPADYRKAQFDIGVFGDTYEDVMTLSDKVRDRLDGFGQTVGTVEFAPVMLDGESDTDEATPEGQEKPIYLRVITFRCLYRETD